MTGPRHPALPRGRVLVGDARALLATLPPASVDMVLTSPPYFRLRDYGVPGQLGLEESVEEWAADLLSVLDELARLLTPTGSLWLNLGDSYAVHPEDGARPKSLLLGPERLALALIARGWLLRNKLIWHKTNPIPSPVRDRLTASWEIVYLLTRQPRSHFDLDSIREPHRSTPPASGRPRRAADEAWRGPNSLGRSGLRALKDSGRVGHRLGKNPGDVWRISSSHYRGPHPATFPLALAERAIRAGCPKARCTRCRTPWRRQLLHSLGGTAVRSSLGPGCACAAPAAPGVVLDPFMGAGTTGLAAEHLGRDWLGIELNPDFAAAAEKRIAAAGPPGEAAA